MSEPNQTQILNSCPECEQVIDVTQVRPYEKIICPHCEEAIRVRNAFNNFTILSELGEGGMSRVFRAEDNTLGREVALKILHTHFGDNPGLQAQFEREAKVTASINHPNVVEVYSVGADQGYFFIAMELLETASLDQQIFDLGQIDEVNSLRIIHDVTHGLAAAQERGLIHRDIKPGNILVDREGTAKLVDFGLALVQGEEEQAAELWATPFYVPPEKLIGRPEDFRSDIYSLGATLYHMLAGRPPFEANTNSIDELIALKAQPVNLKSDASQVGSETVALVHRMMANKPELRFASYADLSQEIARIRQKVDPGFEVESSEAGGVPLWLKLGGALLVVGFVGGVSALLFGGRDNVEKVEISKASSIGSGNSEVIVSAEETRLNRQLSTARKALAAGSLESAREMFAELSESEKAGNDLKAWSEFHLGLLDLLDDDEAASIPHFERCGELTDGVAKRDQAILSAAAEKCSEEGPIAVEEIASIEESGALLHLPLGIKNWLHDDFRAAEGFLKAYNEATFPSNASWMGSYKSSASHYLEEAAVLTSLPKISDSLDLDALGGVITELEKTKEELGEGRGQSVVDRQLTKARTRMEELSTMAQREAEDRDRASLGLALEELRDLPSQLDFSKGAETWRNIQVETDFGKRISRSNAESWEAAAKFYPAFAARIGTYRYEGEIRRRQGSPFTARIVSADKQTLVVDLGFGDTTLKLSTIEPGSLLDIAKDTVIPDLPDQGKEATAFYAFLIGDNAYAERLSEDLQDLPGFLRRWDALTIPLEFQ
ncbi:MAG: serine/threonine-protein kinase, partial [Verrucomicrobiota bacterium]